MSVSRTKPCIAAFILAALAFSASAAGGAPVIRAVTAAVQPKTVYLGARSAILIEFAEGRTLFEKNADLPIPPASLTKIMTIHLAYKALAEGKINRNDIVTITREMCALPPGSSLLGLQPGERVTVWQLMLGMAVASGNDAAYALAIAIAGSLKDFTAMMNAEAASLGFKVMYFTEPSGIDERNMVTAREYADFCRRYLIMHPDSLAELHSVPYIDFPLPANLPPGSPGNAKTVRQANRNMLLEDYQGCDGLKTGYIRESGYSIALTAKRGGTRLIAVSLGGPGNGSAGGYSQREKDGGALLDYGFANFVTVSPVITKMTPVKVWKGETDEIIPVPAATLAYTLAREKAGQLRCRIEKTTSVVAPIKPGTELGALVYSVEGTEVRRVPLIAENGVAQGGFFKRLRDTILMLFE